MIDAKYWIVAGALIAGLGVVAGAFGAHGLETKLKTPPDASQQERDLSARRLHNFEVAVRYQMYHALGLILVGMVGLHTKSAWISIAGWLFIAGLVIFSGMLYGWVLFQVRALAMIVPIGGTAFILGWLALAIAAAGVPREPARAAHSSAQ